MNLGRVSSAALMASGLAGVVMPGRVGSTLELAAGTKRGIAETRAGVGVTWLGAAAARVGSLVVDRPRTDGAYWAYLAAEIGLGAVALVGARRARTRL